LDSTIISSNQSHEFRYRYPRPAGWLHLVRLTTIDYFFFHFSLFLKFSTEQLTRYSAARVTVPVFNNNRLIRFSFFNFHFFKFPQDNRPSDQLHELRYRNPPKIEPITPSMYLPPVLDVKKVPVHLAYLVIFCIWKLNFF